MNFTLNHFDDGIEHLSVDLGDAGIYEADSDHPWWDEIVDLVANEDWRVRDLFPLGSATKLDDKHHWIDDLDDDELEELVTGIPGIPGVAGPIGPLSVPNAPKWGFCGDPDCPECYGNPDTQAPEPLLDTVAYGPRVDNQAPSQDLEYRDELIDVLRVEVLDAEIEIDDLAEKLATSNTDANRWQNRALWLEAAVKNYAGHAWPEIKQGLDL
jgi:hypothetical protein